MKERFEIVLNANFKDLSPIYFGCTYTKNGFCIGPRTQAFTVISYIFEGTAVLKVGDVTYKIQKGDMIVHPASVNFSLIAQKNNVYNSVYIGFSGNLSHNFSSLPFVSRGSEELFEELYNLRYFEGEKATAVTSFLFKLHSLYIQPKEYKKFDYISQLKEYINTNYATPCPISDMARSLNLNPTYLSRIFKEQTGTTIQNYILTKKLNEAKLLLNNEGKNVTEAAFLCGFNSSSHFSKMFKKYFGTSPKSQRSVKRDQ